MIVKNEAHVIERCLGALRDLVNYWVIIDTGSTDGTQAIIRNFMRDVPGELLERPWVNFAHNRTEALEAARQKADYSFIIDADEVLVYEPGFAWPHLDRDSYVMEMLSGGVSYWKPQLVSNRLNWRYKSVLHEYLDCPEARTEGAIKGARILRFTDGARSRDPMTYRKDALVLEQGLLDEPNNDRYRFYLAQSYRDAGELDLAIKHYQKRVEMGGWIEEVWYSLYQVAELKSRLSQPWPTVLEAYLQAFKTKPDRVEPLFKIAMVYQMQREFHLAFLFFRRAIEIAYPLNDRLFVEKGVYEYLLPMEYAVCAYWIGQHGEAIRVNNALLCREGVPGEIFEQVIKNRRFSLDALHPRKEASEPRRERIKVCIPFHNPGPFLDNCISSLLEQDYADAAFIFIDLGSRDDSAQKAPVEDPRVTLVSCQGAGAQALHEVLRTSCAPQDIVVLLDGEDWLARADALALINGWYQERDCWAMYGQFRFTSGHYGLALPFPDQASFGDLRRDWCYPFICSFRAGLYHAIQSQDPAYACMKDRAGEWLAEAWHAALVLAIFEVAGFDHVCFNDEVLYVYNLDSPLKAEKDQALRRYLEENQPSRLRTVSRYDNPT